MILVPTHGPDDWRRLLADPDKHWREGYSAKMLANRWEESKGLPTEILALLPASAELLLAVPELKVALPGGDRASQNDLFALVRSNEGLLAVTIEGKVEEPFDRSVGEWLQGASPGKQERYRFLLEQLGLASVPPSIRYQLLHRTVSALLLAEQYCAAAAVLVHSFSARKRWFEDFAAFVRLFGVDVTPDTPVSVTVSNGRRLTLGWASGPPLTHDSAPR